MDVVNDYFKRFYPPKELLDTVEPRYSMGGFTQRVDGYSNVFPAMKMADGLELSVQGHWGAYSFPRDDWADEYVTVEVMGPPRADELLAPYERECNLVGERMIYPGVPVRVIAEIIEKHGGLVAEEQANDRAALQGGSNG
jgi:hypothetical protein